MFPPGDADAAAAALRSLLPTQARAAASQAGRKLVGAELTIGRQVDQLLVEYEAALGRAGGGRSVVAAVSAR
jgi:hypothetical protein